MGDSQPNQNVTGAVQVQGASSNQNPSDNQNSNQVVNKDVTNNGKKKMKKVKIGDIGTCPVDPAERALCEGCS